MTQMDPREARFLASQAERLSGNKKQQTNATAARNHSGGGDDDAPEFLSEINSNDNADGIGSKEQSHLFWKSFRTICFEFQNQIDSLLLMPSSSSTAAADSGATKSSNKIPNNENVKAYYATAARRNEGRIKLDSTLQNVRSLQRHALSSSSSVSTSSNHHDDGNNNSNELLLSILQSPMPDITQTEIRLISQEMDTILKRIDGAREIICPKEKFVFKRYRKAMEERERVGGGVHCSTVTESTERKRENVDAEKEGEAKTKQDLRSKYGGVLEHMSNCTIEILSDGTILVDETTEDQLRYYSAPRPVDALLHPASHANEKQYHHQQQQPNTQESSSYLLQNLQNVTLIIHGARPSLHLQHIQHCRIYVSEPTLGPVHVTDCRSSKIRCSAYQLRVHDSNDVTFGVWVRSGPIIEDCKGMVFEGNYYADDGKNEGSGKSEESGVVGRNMFWDVKDFNWLRALRKSPNFVVVTKSTVGNDEEVSKEELRSNTDGTPKGVELAALQAAEEEEDSDDEL
mmetsp:Transcript_37497/g.67528  ORF Transcript_37497/g.67528 Transcript_37497/m.67528 type:complete len:515 (-) Transcript_37497:122-1666(-)|eukprot:CAMPEP_0201931552 /NCGR_PEP_ID=MMETSP0903-20130614/27604_1 /ASSEMBLY_ACC=CAM_ASM_000552 /TAXON_ID=420261 /ORGANISM="Thalassiosira antarctica, Strain CCMP982" /LENGTH=514 /DNA_ID=CAMNT_0048470921 /DNA_START=72 /DNA_END=1616 /DNA_ORIENTATION=-